jgi:manganese/zinc/iron transport system permease protein
MDYLLAIGLIGSLCAAACALPGCFLILRRMAMMSDAISHAILPGLVAGYFLARGPNLILGFLGAVIAALLTVALVEALQNTRKVGGESAIGIVFPAMFALGTFVITKYASNVHLDADAVLFGNIEFAPFDTLIVNGQNLGPQSLWVMAALLLINVGVIALMFKELKLATFDAGLAGALGISPLVVHYALMALVSVTSVGAFTAVGAVLVVALMIVPAAAAYLLTDDLKRMLMLAAGIGVLCALSGLVLALLLDASVAGAIAVMCGVAFALAWLLSPSQGVVAQWLRRRRQRVAFAVSTLLLHLKNHAGLEGEEHEAEVVHLSSELRWGREWALRIIDEAVGKGWVRCVNGHLELTPDGARHAQMV